MFVSRVNFPCSWIVSPLFIQLLFIAQTRELGIYEIHFAVTVDYDERRSEHKHRDDAR